MNLNRKPPQAKIRPAKRPVGRGGKHLWTSSFNADTRFIVSQNLAQEDVDQSLATICDAIVQIRQRRNSSQLSFETLYR